MWEQTWIPGTEPAKGNVILRCGEEPEQGKRFFIQVTDKHPDDCDPSLVRVELHAVPDDAMESDT